MDLTLRALSYQALLYFMVGICIIVVMLLITLFSNASKARILILLLISTVNIIVGSYTVNCMVKGSCDAFAWIWTFFGLITVFSLFIGSMQ
jgi:hypothetical protein